MKAIAAAPTFAPIRIPDWALQFAVLMQRVFCIKTAKRVLGWTMQTIAAAPTFAPMRILDWVPRFAVSTMMDFSTRIAPMAFGWMMPPIAAHPALMLYHPLVPMLGTTMAMA